MCLILVGWRADDRYACVIAANRDEFFARPASAAHWWSDQPLILAGRDAQGGGTWLGITRQGRWAALTNYRQPGSQRADAPSRGEIVTALLLADGGVEPALEELRANGARYNGFNVLFSDGRSLGVYESMSGRGEELPAGVYGLSNHLLDTPWPKVRQAKSRLTEGLARLPDTSRLLALLRDSTPADDADLPRTGLSLPWERMLSSAFIRAPGYGTRCSTIVTIGHDGAVRFTEWTWDPAGELAGRVDRPFNLPTAAG
jgi:uncharacterized protein with NRDE domain